ncbi:MAG: D-alanine--D-alanine ligase family protein [Oligoflexus sp.]
MSAQKKTIAVIFGGQSTEHEISCRSATFLFRNIPRDRYQVAALAVSKDGQLMPQNIERIMAETQPTVRIVTSEAADPVSLAAFRRLKRFVTQEASEDMPLIVFSIMHGTFGEDGCWQGFWNLADLPFVGVDVLGSAVAMDKEIAKKLVSLAEVPIVPYVTVQDYEWRQNAEAVIERIESQLQGSNYFIKPASLGSSVGISRAKNRVELQEGMNQALGFDQKVLVEQCLEVREIEFAVLGTDEPRVSLPGEVVSNSGFYSYDTKYVDADGAKILIPAPLTAEQTELGQKLALKIYHALNLFGMSRIDLFLDKTSGQFYFNEANTLPGLTSVSQYPLLWQHMGLSSAELIHQLVETAVYRHERKKRLQRVLQTN